MFDRPLLATIKSRSSVLQDATVREFSGGWNVVDNDLNLSTRFATVLDNMSREEDGSMGVRWGTQYLSSIDDTAIVSTDLTAAPFNTFAELAYRENDTALSFPVTNNAIWHDTVTSQTNAVSTRVAIAAVPADYAGVTLRLTGTFSAATRVDYVYVDAPSDGWITGTAADEALEIRLLAYAFVGATAYIIRDQKYPANKAPRIWTAPVPVAIAPLVTQVRIYVQMPLLPKGLAANIGVAEMRAYSIITTGGLTWKLPANIYIVNTYYFQDSVLRVLSNGTIQRVLGDGTTTVVWSQTIAKALVGAPNGWGKTDFASFAVFNGKLIICNGTDKPLLVDFKNTPPVQYLADNATGANGNVPICRYVVAMNKYLVMAGDPLHPDRIHISNQNTSGTWYGDAAPNDATYVDLGKTGVQGEQTVTGINRYRDQLVVAFYSASVLGKLGTYTTDTPPVHKPSFEDVVEGYGGHSHRCMVNLGNDLFMLDGQGVISIARSLYSGSTEPKRVSELIDPAINANVTRLSTQDVLLGSHAVYNGNDKQYMCFIPNYSETNRPAPANPFEVLAHDRRALWMRIPSHNLEVGDSVTISGATFFNTLSAVHLNVLHIVDRVVDDNIIQIVLPEAAPNTDPNGVLTGGGYKVNWKPMWTETYGYIYTFINELKIRAWARYRGWRWRASCRTELSAIILSDDRISYTYGNENMPLFEDYIGTTHVTPIAFAWELPWADFDKRAMEKHLRYMQLDTNGTATFTMMMFVDMLYKQQGLLTPNNIMSLMGGDNGGYGNNGQPYGGGRRTSDQRLYAWTARGKLFKLRYEGIVREPLNVVAITLMYQNGSIRR